MSSNFKYFTFPPTPTRITPKTSTSDHENPSTPPSPSPKPSKSRNTMAPPTVSGKTPQKLAKNTSGPTTPKPPKLSRPQVEDDAEDSKSKVEDTIEEPSKVEMKDSSQAGDLEEAEPTPIPDEDEKDLKDTSGGAEKKVQDETEDEPETETDAATEKAGDIGESEVEEDDKPIQKKGQQVLGGAKNIADKATKGDVSGATDDVKDTAEDAKDDVADTTEDVKDKVEDTTSADLPDVPDLSILKGLEVDEQGLIHDKEGNAIGRLVEGDAEDLAGWEIGDDGEILDDDGDLVGRTELLPEKAKELAQEAKTQGEDAAGNLPSLSILKGLTVDVTGNILNDDGDTVGQLVEGDPKQLLGKTLNEKGEFLDDDGNVIGRAQVHPDAADFIDQAEDAADDAGQDAEEGIEETGDAIDDSAEEAKAPVDEAGNEIELPGIEALEGHEVGSDGNVVDEAGNVIGELAEGDAEDVKGLKINEQGEVLDSDGKVVGKVQLADGAAEVLAGITPDLRILDGLKVNKKGKILDSEGEVIGELIDGEADKCAGKKVNSKGEVIDSEGNLLGRVKVVPGEAADEAMKEFQANNPEEGEEAPEESGEAPEESGEAPEEPTEETGEPTEEENLPPLSVLEGLKVNKGGKLINDKGVVVGELIEGDAKKISKLGLTADDQGQFWDNKGHVIGKAKTVQVEDADEDGPFHGLEGLIVTKDGMVKDENDNIVGKVVEGDAKKLVGRAVDEDGDIIDKRGSVIGRAERYEEPEEQEPEPEQPADLSILDGKTVNKQGNVVDSDGTPIGRLIEGNAKDLAGRKCDENGLIHNDTGKVVGRCELIPENERVAKKEGPFAGFEGLRVVKDGKVEDEDGNVVGILVEGNTKRLVGHPVDEDGDIIDKYGNVKGHADPYEEEEAAPVDLSALAGCTVNKAGNVVDANGAVVGRVAEGEVKNMIGRKVDGEGQIWNNSGKVIGRAELVEGADSKPDGPFSGFDNNTIAKDGTVQTADGTIIGRVIEGDIKKLVGHKVDDDGDISDKNGNTIGKAERWEPEEKERRINPMSGRRVSKTGEVRDENGDVMGKLTAGDLGHCVGLEVDDNGYVVDNDGNRVGEVTLLENIQEEEVPEDETEEDKQKREDAELADKMSNICQQTLERIQPVMKQITEYIEKADRTPKDELDEEELVNNVKPLIEEGSRILQECNGSLRGLDPDGRIAQQAKGRAQTRDATPQEYRLADLLKELTTNVVTTIDNAKKKLQDMPHAKKKLNPLWALLTEPLFQIIAAVGLLLSGVLGLVGRLLNALGLGGLVNGLLGGLGIDKLLGGLGLGSITDMLGGGKKDKKKGGGVSNIPLVGGLLGGGK
jgi:hypothetical protein